MVKAVVPYGPRWEPDAFERYYAETHTALAKAIPGLQRFEIAGASSTDPGQDLSRVHDRMHVHVDCTSTS